ncbi:MAG: hypothetical protein II572_08985, partial [Clostridia bacterium]|nr:hypothetical protein [Clostridia bacterium]
MRYRRVPGGAPGRSGDGGDPMSRQYYLGEVLKGGTRALGLAGIENARYDAEELLGHVTGVSPRELLVHRDRALDEETVK